ncbi:MAG: PilN domain-containing protein [Candidatus Hydrogenedentes bacterium]|nr:PilN domain-containing protein [Candidatus Hydrogenedentota bacterium]
MGIRLTQKLRQLARNSAAQMVSGKSVTPKSGRVLVVEQTPSCGWKVIDAEIGDAITVLDARTIAGENQRDAAALLAAANGTAITLVPDSRKAVCRLIEIANASPDQIEQMVALRLEVELPYPAAETTWVCEPCLNGRNTSRALLLATPTKDIAQAERALGLPERRSVGVEFAPAGLVELALASHPAEGSMAVAGIDDGEAVLALAYGGTLAYSRHIRMEGAAGEVEGSRDAWASHFAREVKQSLYDYLLRTGNAAPECIYLAGKAAGQAVLQEAIARYLETPVRNIGSSGLVRMAKPEMTEDELIAGYPVCLGTLLAMRKRWRGERSVSPAFRKERRGIRLVEWRTRLGTLAALNVALLVLLGASVFGVRAVQQNADERLMQESRPLLGGLQGLQEELEILQFEKKGNRSVVDAMAALAEALPPEIQVESLSIDTKGKVTFFGKADSVDAASEKVIAALKGSRAFVNPQFNGATREKEKFTFQITCELANGGRGSS